ncbi:hypothetical protein L6452_28923 [Arctium lappa]|uniref:Uncharacterized protein n=1 Tax=Arctium lappa TaxID=4217 RepID=A0ACB9A009_ARCLA|nr:hypothetical protein L6452_28923 [Arctium lappa]
MAPPLPKLPSFLNIMSPYLPKNPSSSPTEEAIVVAERMEDEASATLFISTSPAAAVRRWRRMAVQPPLLPEILVFTMRKALLAKLDLKRC